MNPNKAIDQYNADAGLLAEFEQSAESGKSFNYSKSVTHAPKVVPEEQITAYLSKIQRGGLIQSFGCMLAIEEPTFKIISYSENCFDLLGLGNVFESEESRGLIGVDARTLFSPSSVASLVKAVSSREISMLNPIWVHSRSTQDPFYAILHRIDVGVVIDLEPASSGDPALPLVGAVQSQKLVVRAISRLQSLPGGDIGVLCDTIVEEVGQLTGYDRVMVYKFHDDGHGEVISETRRSDLEPYLGLHYPATDIPQAARFLFMQNRVRIICDCQANPVRVVQSEELEQPLSLVNSTLRSPHSCHMQYMVNMGSIASLVLAVVIDDNETMKLWGLVACHHTSPRFVPSPLRYACEFLMKAFGLQLYMGLQLVSQLAEKKLLWMQTMLCDMLLRDAPYGIVTHSPSMMDLVKCDGAALYYSGKCWLLGVSPTESQIKDITEWLLNNHKDSTGLSTDSLADAGYPGASLLGDAVCGMTTAKITSKDFLFWFRSHTVKEVKWGGAMHHPKDEDDSEKMHPRSSFKAFLEVVRSRSLPWKISEINAIQSLQLIMRDSFQDIEDKGLEAMINGSGLQGVDELSSVACEMGRLIETASAPVFGVDSTGFINGWNAKIAELTGLQSSKAMGKSLFDEVVQEDSRVIAENVISRALQGEEDKNVELKLRKFGLKQQNSVLYIVGSACASRDYKNNIVGVCFVGQDITPEKIVLDKFIRLQRDYKAIVQSLNPLIPPIFASDENACCSEWNAAMEKLTGWMRHEIIGKMLPGEIFGGFCRLKGQDMLTKFTILLYQVIGGHNSEKFPFGFFDRKGKYVEVFLMANKRTEKDGNIIGCFCFLQNVVSDMQAFGNKQENGERLPRLELAYIRQEMKNPVNGLRFIHKLLESTAVSEDQKQLLETSDACERQIISIIEDLDLGKIQDGSMELNMEEFLLGNVIDAIVCQVMNLVKEKNLQLVHEIPDEIKTLYLFGDQVKLQLVLSDFLMNMARYAPSPNGWVEIKVSPGLKLIQDGDEYVQLQIRITHPGQGLPSALTEDMFEGRNQWTMPEGLGLNLSRKLLNMMNGHVHYAKEQDRCYFLIDLELRKTRQGE
ncbi:Phytochrome E like [Actinidia chinensis var. chinensis]|uniref:Phytochrome E like n=1 Tax=Actinidia chinensis var. chinensis TaxID=1590841 RepID=A0A2R6QAF5_ACTCC|nr:Phytochrome E like [Actinidia chinensis var. chinensis]